MIHDFDWVLERVDVAKWMSQDPGKRDLMAACPVHGGSDSLHVTENSRGKALLTCFACGAKYADIIRELQDGKTDEPAAEPETPAMAVTVTRTRKTGAPAPSAGATITPLDWAAARCGMTRAELDALGLPISERGDRVIFEFGRPGIAKTRRAVESKKKDITWEGGSNPPLWPVPTAPEEDIVICEGEFDAIALRGAGFDAYSITGGSGNVPDRTAFEALYELGVRAVFVLFDADEAGRKGHEALLEEARAAGLETRPMRVRGVQPLMDEKDARDVAVRAGAASLQLEPADDEDAPAALDSFDAVEPAPLLLGYLHPTEHTILYGDGGTGKGVIAAWWVAQLLARPGFEDYRVLVVDYEAHTQHEWRPRIESFLTTMGKAPRLSHVSVVQPTKPIWDIQDWLKDAARGFDFVVIDSVTYACVGEEAEKSATAIKYTMAVNRLGLPVLSIAHVTKADDNPKHPFGSVYWSNGARITIAVSRKEPAPDAPRVLKNWKSNQRREFPDTEIPWGWVNQEGPPTELTFGPVVRKVSEIVLDTLTIDPNATPEEIEEEVMRAIPDATKAAIGMAIGRARKKLDGAVTVNNRPVRARQAEGD